MATESDVVALLTRFAANRLVAAPELLRLTRTALDVGGPCVEAFGMITESCSAVCGP